MCGVSNDHDGVCGCQDCDPVCLFDSRTDERGALEPDGLCENCAEGEHVQGAADDAA